MGLIGGANPGPILISSCTESVKHGFKKALKIILWALVAETAVAVAIVAIIYSLNPPQGIFYGISLFGGLYLIYIAWHVSRVHKIDNSHASIFTLRKIFVMTLFNGSFWLFWITICVPLAFQLRDIIPSGPVIFWIFFEGGWFIATALIVYIFSHFKNFFAHEDRIKWFYIGMALILFYFAVKMIVGSLIYFLK